MTALIIALAAVTLAYRLLPLALLERFRLPSWARDWLELVPGAVLAAMLCQAVLLPGEAEPWKTPELLAAVPAAAVAWRTRSMVRTMVTGMLVYALLSHML
ncbi:MAG: AzlD domain-containing protein [Chloroflexi bacterium]|jgi:branched-subunit amino acid transport protein|nr:AzlD domain-containing protein [Chloroflexota bacterium]